MKKMKIIAVAASTMVAVIQTAQAGIDYETSTTLANLEANSGNYLTVDSKVFSGFSDNVTGAAVFDPTTTIVTASIGAGGVDLLTWSTSITVTALPGTTAVGDVLLNYVVTSTGAPINEIDQNYTGGVGSGLGSITIAETVTAPGSATILGSTYLNIANTSEPAFNLNSSLPFISPPQQSLAVTKDIGITAVGYNASLAPELGFVSISQVQQSFHQNPVPEPTTMISGALLLLPFGASTLRILRKKRVAV